MSFLADLKKSHAALERPEPVATPAGMTGVLVVEDEPAIRRLFALSLRAGGFHVHEACNGADALAILDRAGRVDLLVTDVVMPVMSGPELVAALQPQMPELRVIFASGYAVDDEVARGAQVLLKPFAQKQLLETIRVALNAPPPSRCHAA